MTSRDEVLRAPGKAMLFGEYAVLEGAPALVAAVDRYVTARRVSRGRSTSPFVVEARAAALREHQRRGSRPRLPALAIDSSPLYEDGANGRKLGLGSSAAVTAVAVGSWPELPREALWRMCQEAHCRAQGARGSGADLAAAIWGGVIRFQLDEAGCQVAPIELSAGTDLTLIDSGEAAATGQRLERLAALKERDPQRHRRVMDPLLQLARAVADEAQATGSIDPVKVRAWNDALAPLADAIDLPIMTAALRAIAACAGDAGGAAKPSGAGGGDLAICFTPTAATARLRQRLLDLGFKPLAIRLGARGLHATHDPRGAANPGGADTDPQEAKASP